VIVTTDTTLVLNAERAHEPLVQTFVQDLQRRLTHCNDRIARDDDLGTNGRSGGVGDDMSAAERDAKQLEIVTFLLASAGFRSTAK
jgi:hypothetical protein